VRARAAAIALLVPIAALAQVRTDSSLGRPAASIPGPNYIIPQDAGRLAGRNLFHSFETFNIGSGESATFTASTPGLANILARVSGGSSSQINGLLRVEAGGAQPAFWLINPAGVVFGGGASLSVPGAFHVTTANYIRFGDGDFHADPAKASTFSSLSPEAYGFLGTTRASVRIEAGALLSHRATVDIVAGDVSIGQGQLLTHSGDIRIAAMGGQVSVVGLDGPVVGASGNVSIVGGSVQTQAFGSNAGGNISLYAGELSIDGGATAQEAGLYTTTEGSGRSGDIHIDVGGRVSIVNGAAIATATSANGNAGDIHLRAGDLLVDGKGIDDTGLVSLSESGAAGRAGNLDVEVARGIRLYEGAAISSDTASAGAAGEVRVTASSLVIDGRGNVETFTGISSDGRSGSAGSAGHVAVQVAGAITMTDGAEISSQIYGTGDAGGVQVTAGSIAMDGKDNPDTTTAIHSTANGARGNAGSVKVDVDGLLVIANSAVIDSDTYSSGHGGDVNVTAREIRIDGGTGEFFTGISSDAVEGSGSAGNVHVHAGKLTIVNTGLITSDTYSSGNAGNVTVSADEIRIDGSGREADYTGISSDALDGTGSAGTVDVHAGKITVMGSGAISSDTYTSGRAGNVLVTADQLLIDGSDSAYWTGISTSARGGSGAAGRVEVHSDTLTLLRGGAIASDTSTSGDAGSVRVTANTLTLAGAGPNANVYSKIESRALGGTGNSGVVEVDISGNATLADAGTISSSTLTSGKAGDVTVRVGGDLTISGASNGTSGIFSNTYTQSGGPAGSVKVEVGGALALAHGGVIESDTHAGSNAGSIRISAGSLQIAGSDGTTTGISTDSANGAGGQAGDISLSVRGDASISNGGFIASRTQSAGSAGTIQINAGNLAIDGSGTTNLTGISTSSSGLTSGNAGQIEMQVEGNLALRGGGVISSATTSSAGAAGSIVIRTGNLIVDGATGPSQISARSTETGSGQTGEILVSARESIAVSNGGQITVANQSNAADPSQIVASRIALEAPAVLIASNGSVTAQSSGNVSASNIEITAPGSLLLDSGSITTSANLGNGGTITIDAGKVRLVNSQLTTSVLGTRGNGGDISIRADALQLETGFIQANTAARDAAGGNVAIDARVLVASGGVAFIGGSEPIAFVPGTFGLNVIQAAAPTGVSGVIDLTSPVLDTSGALTGLGAAALDTSLVGRSPCRVGAGSSLALAGRGGLAPSARDGFRLDPPALAAAGPFSPGRLAFAGSPCRASRVAL
jgi:filamentous hemagglutinin family protein